ncbi:MAG: apolipoprotein N-acyltransferase [Planctomycetota bacterium]|nr:MAG: apolipoprotein N-acyltransferase [Planctomycetota bacterium]
MGTAQVSARRAPRKSPAQPPPPTAAPWWRSTLGAAFAGLLLFWAALPPLEWAPLAWVAPVPWIWLVRRESLSGRRPYLALWSASVVFYLATLYWVTLPHWATSIGWVVLSLYLAVYLPAFVALARVAVHRLGVSSIIAAPVIWTGLEFARANLFTGFGIVTFAHTQYRVPTTLQICDLAGPYGLTFAIVLAAACIARMLPCGHPRFVWWPAVPLVGLLAAVVAYGQSRLDQETTELGPKVALVQGSIDIDMKYDEAEGEAILAQYYGLTKRAVREYPDLDLIVWPETMFRDAWLTFAPDYVPSDDVEWTVDEAEAFSRRRIKRLIGPLDTPFLIGIDTWYYRPGEIDHFNTALFTDRTGKVIGRYDKCHLVPFGEYVWFADTFPWLYKLTPLPRGSDPGTSPESIASRGVNYAPNICYENTLPHLIRRQVVALRAGGREPDVLVNLTNDGWFWGSHELDMHLSCAVLRAVECRKPFLVAANTGFSAVIDSSGRIRQQGRRRATDLLVSRVDIDSRTSPYLLVGDLPAGLCLLATTGVGLFALVGAIRRRKVARTAKLSDPNGA